MDESIIQVDLDDEVILFLALEAHKRDITLNKLINEILKDYIESPKEELKDD